MTSVLMTTEGTYPYSAGGVSTWCDALLRNTPDVRYRLLPVMMSPHIEAKYEPPPNVRSIINVPMWGIEEPAEFTSAAPFSDLYERKRRTSVPLIEREFIPLLSRFLLRQHHQIRTPIRSSGSFYNAIGFRHVIGTNAHWNAYPA